jgi:stearoyl-CoA desaturase (Delta-9 desaturase)
MLLVVPTLATIAAAALAWQHGIGVFEISVFGVLYVATFLGITLGYHRLWSHRAYEARAPFRLALGILGSMCAQGPVLYWAANHRRHHKYSDREFDMHSPIWSYPQARSWRGFVHAQMLWPFRSMPSNTLRLVGDLMSDPVVAFVNRTYFLWILVGLAIPAAAGWIVVGTAQGALSGLLWGGGVRLFVGYHVTSSVNSVCHLLGVRRFVTRDNSRNLWWLSLVTLGESWHNNHHAFPWSSRLGLSRSEPDPGAWVLAGAERCGWVYGLRVPSADAMRAAEVTARQPRASAAASPDEEDMT